MGERDIRIGDAEREQALQLLGEHVGAGRLTVDEYGERSARVTATKTRGELLALFDDLPPPHPTFARVAPLPTIEPPAVRQSGALDPRIQRAAVPLVGLLCVALFFAVKNPLVFLLIPAVAIVVGNLGNRRGGR